MTDPNRLITQASIPASPIQSFEDFRREKSLQRINMHHKGEYQTVVVDSDQPPVMDASEIGLDSFIDKEGVEHKPQVVATGSLGGKEAKKDFAIVSVDGQFQIHGISDKYGSPRSINWLPITEKGITVGRSKETVDADGHAIAHISDLWGHISNPVEDSALSSTHATFTVRNNKLVIVDRGSTNGTEINLIDKNKYNKSEQVRRVISAVGQSSVSGKMESVNPDDSDHLAAVKVLEEGLTDSDKTNIWRYASAVIRMRDAQAENNGNASITENQNAGQALRALSNQGQARADEYLRLMQLHDRELRHK